VFKKMTQYIAKTKMTYQESKEKWESLGLTVKEDGNRALVTYPNKSTEDFDFSRSEVRQFKGAIYQIEPFEMICPMFQKPDRYEDSKERVENQYADYTVEELLDGSLMKLYYWDGDWRLSTNRCISAINARWNNYRSFEEYFYEAFDRTHLESLNKDLVYGFVLCHPENRIVTIYASPTVYHVYTAKKSDGTEVDVELDIKEVQKPRTRDIKTFEQFEMTLERLPWNDRGFMLIRKTENGVERVVCEGTQYLEVKTIRGDQQNMVYRYLDLQKNNPEGWKEFVHYYPEYASVEIQLNQLSTLIHWLYMSYYVNKTTRFIHPKYWELTNELHTLYLRTKQPTTFETVRKHLLSFPTNKLCALLKGSFHSAQQTQ
jgi:hypothetical protein